MLFHYSERKLFDNIMLNNDFLLMQKIILTHTRVPQERRSKSVNFLRTFFTNEILFSCVWVSGECVCMYACFPFLINLNQFLTLNDGWNKSHFSRHWFINGNDDYETSLEHTHIHLHINTLIRLKIGSMVATPMEEESIFSLLISICRGQRAQWGNFF